MNLGHTAADDILDTPELETPPAEADAHRGEITSVESKFFENTGTTGIQVNLKSHDAAFEAELMYWPPKEFVTNYAEVMADPTVLSDTPPVGKKRSPRQAFAAVIANTDKDAEIQKLVAIATEALGDEGAKARVAGLPKPTNFGDFVAKLNVLLAGVPVVFTRKADEKAENPAYRKKLKVNRIYGMGILGSTKALKNYKKAWLNE